MTEKTGVPSEEDIELAVEAENAWERRLEDILNGLEPRGTAHLAFIPFLQKVRTALSARIAELEKENARLKYDMEAMNSIGDERIRSVEAENARLRGDGREYAIVCHFQNEMDRMREALEAAQPYVLRFGLDCTAAKVREALKPAEEK